LTAPLNLLSLLLIASTPAIAHSPLPLTAPTPPPLTAQHSLAQSSSEAAELQEVEQLNQQGFQLYQQGQYEAAIPLAQRALEIRERLFGADHPDVATSLNNLAVLYHAQGRYSAAEPLYQRSLAIEETNLARLLIAGSETQKRAYMATLAHTTDLKISFHLQSMPDSVAAARLALTTVLQRKGRVLDAVTDNLHQLRQRLEAEDQALLDQLAAVRRQLAALWFGGVGDLITRGISPAD
jgi:tetratricopeptide (TPR) repeat protein